VLRHDPLWRFACSDARGLTPLETKHPSQATLSRLITCLSRPDNLDTVHEGLLRLAIWRLNSLPTVTSYTNDTPLTLDIDGLPIEVFGHQDGSAYNGYAGTLIYAALQQCWNDDRLIAADRLWAISHIQYQYVIMACFLVLYGIPVMPKIARGSRSTPT